MNRRICSCRRSHKTGRASSSFLAVQTFKCKVFDKVRKMKILRYLVANLKRLTGSERSLWIVTIGIIFFVRLLGIGVMGLMPQDAYYYLYGQHLALSYFDHPPAIAYLLRIFTDLFGERVFVLKMADSFVTLLSFISFYKLAGCFLSARRVVFACLLLFSTLMISTLSLVSTPDVPLILFWTLSLFTLYQAIFLNKKSSWILSGILMGFAFDSKYTGVFLPAGLVLFLLLSPAHRLLLRSKRFWVCMLACMISVSPVIWWNWQHGFASFLFQTSGRMDTTEHTHLKLSGFLGVLGHQSAILMPVLFVALLWIVFKGIKRYVVGKKQVTAKLLFLYSFFVPVFLLFTLISFFYWVKLNWMMPAYISGIMLAGMYIRRKWLYSQLAFSVVVHLAVAAEIIFYPVAIKSDDTWFGWKQLSDQVEDLQERYPGTFVFSADDYKTSAVLNFYLDSMVYGRNVIGESALQFDYIGTDLSRLKGRNALFLNSVPRLGKVSAANGYPRRLAAYFDSVTELDPVLVQHRGGIVRKFLVYYCRRYHPQTANP